MKHKESKINIMLGAAFLMATSAVGPGFLTQTAYYTEHLLASFAFVILITTILDIGAQTSIWTAIAVTKKKGQDIAESVCPGLGYIVSIFIVIGGFAFNIGNVGGGGLALNTLLGINPILGACIVASVCILIFVFKEAGAAMDHIVKILGALMILLIGYVMFQSNPPYASVLKNVVIPEKMSFTAIITIVGGTIGGYITFSGGHRLLDAGITGVESLSEVKRTLFIGISATTIIRTLLFLAVLGVVSVGVKLRPENPAETVFLFSAGYIGQYLFGFVLLAASITSIIGAAYTSTSFLEIFHKSIKTNKNWWTIGIIVCSTVFFIIIGEPVKLLIFAGTVNGFILPLVLGATLLAFLNKKLIFDYKLPLIITILGLMAFIATSSLVVLSIVSIL